MAIKGAQRQKQNASLYIYRDMIVAVCRWKGAGKCRVSNRTKTTKTNEIAVVITVRQTSEEETKSSNSSNNDKTHCGNVCIE